MFMLNILDLTVNFFFLRYLDKVLQNFRKKVSNFQILQLLWRFRAFRLFGLSGLSQKVEIIESLENLIPLANELIKCCFLN